MAGKYRRPRAGGSDRKTTIYLDEDLKDRLTTMAHADGRSLSAFIEILVREQIERSERIESESPSGGPDSGKRSLA